jgi:hypothetical protein
MKDRQVERGGRGGHFIIVTEKEMLALRKIWLDRDTSVKLI